MNTLTQITVPFHNAELYLVEHNGQPYTPMRSIVQGMGLDWASQFVKLKQRFASCVVEITMQILGDDQARSHTCLLLRKLPAWLYSIHANKVKPEIRDTVIKYQEECDDVLWDYWTKGVAINPRQTITPEQQAILHSIVDRRVNGFDSLRGGLWKRHNKHFGIAKYSQLLASRFDDAVVYLETAELRYPKPKEKINDGCYFLMAKDGVVIYQLPISQQVINSELANNKPLLLEHIKQVVGEFVGKEALPVPKPLVINLPRETARHTQNGANLFSLNILQRAYGVQGNPLAQLFGLLATAEQHHQPIIIKDIEGAKAIYDITKELAHQSQYALEMIAQTANKFCSGGSYFGNL